MTPAAAAISPSNVVLPGEEDGEKWAPRPALLQTDHETTGEIETGREMIF